MYSNRHYSNENEEETELKEQINKEVIKAVVDVNNTLELLKDNLDVLFNEIKSILKGE